MGEARKGRPRQSELVRLREENRRLSGELEQAAEQVLQLSQQLAAVEVIVRNLAGGLDAVVTAWKDGDDVVPHLEALQRVIGEAKRKPC